MSDKVILILEVPILILILGYFPWSVVWSLFWRVIMGGRIKLQQLTSHILQILHFSSLYISPKCCSALSWQEKGDNIIPGFG